MKFILEFAPLILFFIANKLYGIYVATGVVIVGTIISIAWQYFKEKHVPVAQWITLAIMVVFGGATLIFHDDTFIKWKPTVLYWLFASVLLISDLFLRKNLLQKLLGHQLQLPIPQWKQLNGAWAIFFAALGGLNLWVAHLFSLDDWVTFKVFGTTGLLIVFVIGQAIWCSKYIASKH
jgi:intracellular septation protein